MQRARAFLRRVPGLARLAGSDPVMMLRGTWRRHGHVEEAWRFTVLELLGRGGRPTSYLLPGGEVRIALRHRTRDVEIFEEIFTGSPAYAPPAPAAAMLAAGTLRVLDLGGNIGLFAAHVLQEYRVASIVSFEPDPHNLPVLRRCQALNAGRPWNLVAACAAPVSGTATFAAGAYADSHVTSSPGPGTVEVPAVDVLPYMMDADLIKVDIEGSEWPLLADPRLPGLRDTVLVLEWHAFGSGTPDPFARAAAHLRSAGFTVDGVDHGLSHGTLWAWKR